MGSGPLPDPIQQGNTLIWTGPFSLPMGDSLPFPDRALVYDRDPLAAH